MLLYVLLAVVWAFVLIPMWWDSHNKSSQVRSADRFSRALGVLAQRGNRQDTMVIRRPAGPGVVMPGRASAETGQLVSAARPVTTPASRSARRRRRVLLALLVLLTVVLVASWPGVFAAFSPWWAGLPAVLLGAFLISSRRQVAQARMVASRRAQRAVLREAASTAMAARAQRPLTRPGTRVLESSETAEELVGVRDQPAQPAPNQRWHAVDQTLPTYVTAPAASKVPRAIDREVSGDWGAAIVERASRTRQNVSTTDSGMRVESFEIGRRAYRPGGDWGIDQLGSSYGDMYVDTAAGHVELSDTEELADLLDDPRTGVGPQLAQRRAAG